MSKKKQTPREDLPGTEDLPLEDGALDAEAAPQEETADIGKLTAEHILHF